MTQLNITKKWISLLETTLRARRIQLNSAIKNPIQRTIRRLQCRTQSLE
jgi:hypothetical protein